MKITFKRKSLISVIHCFMDEPSFWGPRHSTTVECEVRKHAASVKLVYLYSRLQIKATTSTTKQRYIVSFLDSDSK